MRIKGNIERDGDVEEVVFDCEMPSYDEKARGIRFKDCAGSMLSGDIFLPMEPEKAADILGTALIVGFAVLSDLGLMVQEGVA